jgi:hypothetical protein
MDVQISVVILILHTAKMFLNMCKNTKMYEKRKAKEVNLEWFLKNEA